MATITNAIDIETENYLEARIREIETIIVFAKMNIINEDLFFGILEKFCERCDGNHGKQLKILINVIAKTEGIFEFDKYLTERYATAFDLFACVCQTVFANMNIETFRDRMLQFLEIADGTEDVYLTRAHLCKNLNRIVNLMREYSENGKYVKGVIFNKERNSFYVSFA